MYFKIPDFPLGALLATTLCVIGLLFISPEAPSMWLWEGLIAISFILWALGAGLLSKPRKLHGTKEQKIQTETQEKPTDQNINDGDIPSAIADLINAIKAEGRANRREERKEDREGKIREQITIVFIGITMFAIILQVHEMVKAYEPIHEQARAAAQQAKASNQQASNGAIEALAVKDQAEGAKQAAVAARESLILSYRAWIGPNGATITNPTAGQKAIFNINYQNSGREPAISVVSYGKPFVVTVDEKGNSFIDMQAIMEQCRKTKPAEGAQVVYPTTGFGGSTMSITAEGNTIDADVISGKKIIGVTGCFSYITFATEHHSMFCFFYRNGVTTLPNLNYCGTGNKVD